MHREKRAESATAGPAPTTGTQFADDLVYAAAVLYYQENKKQAEVAAELGTSRPTVSRLLDEARRRGIVWIEVVPPRPPDERLSERVAHALGIQRVHQTPPISAGAPGVALNAALGPALKHVGLHRGDVILVSSGRTMHAVSQSALPHLPGVIVVPTIGGHDEHESWYQPNEIIRQFAARVGGTPRFIFAPAMPSATLHATLMAEARMRDLFTLWSRARCFVFGIGAPPLQRDSLPSFVPRTHHLVPAVGDICSRYFDRDGNTVTFPGCEHLLAITLDTIDAIPNRIAVAYGPAKVPAILAAARAGHLTDLVTDETTAIALAAAPGAAPPPRPVARPHRRRTGPGT